MLFELPYCISANRYWRNFRGITVLSSEARKYKEDVKTKYNYLTPIEGDYMMILIVHPKLTKKGIASKVYVDLSNALKVTEDALQEVAFTNDRNAKKIILDWGLPKPNGGLTVIVTPINIQTNH
jgi:crossover junction endodeoxyribonuclease RusA